MSERIGALQVGCGQRGQTHARALTDSDRFELLAVCDIDEDAAEETAAAFDVPAFGTDIDSLVDDHRPNHITVVTPATVREDVIAAALAHEPETLVFEKPVATTYEEVAAIAELVEATETKVVVCHQHIYGEELQALKGWLDEGRIGTVERLVGTTNGGLYEHGTHFLHTLNWLLDDRPEWVAAQCQWGEHPFDDWHAEVEPTDAMLELAYPDGKRAFLHLGPDAPDVPAQAGTFWLEYRLDIVGTGGHAQFVLGSHASYRGADGASERVEVDGFDPDGASSAALYDDLANWISGRSDRHPSDFRSAHDTHRIVEAALRSGERNESIAIGDLEVT